MIQKEQENIPKDGLAKTHSIKTRSSNNKKISYFGTWSFGRFLEKYRCTYNSKSRLKAKFKEVHYLEISLIGQQKGKKRGKGK